MIASQGTEWLTADGLGYFLGREPFRKNKIRRWALREGITCFRTSDWQPITVSSSSSIFFFSTLGDCLLLVFVPTLFLPSEMKSFNAEITESLKQLDPSLSHFFFSLSCSQKWFPSIVITTSPFLPETAKTFSPLRFFFAWKKVDNPCISLFCTIFKGHCISCIFFHVSYIACFYGLGLKCLRSQWIEGLAFSLWHY